MIMTIDEMIAVLQAAKAGKQIQINVSDKWTDLDANPSFGAPINSYRVKPEPREWWVNVYDGEPNGYIHTTKAKAEYWQSQAGTRKEVVHVREVID
jgi:hypothetical protein